MKQIHVGTVELGIKGYDAFYLVEDSTGDLTRKKVRKEAEARCGAVGNGPGSLFMQAVRVVQHPGLVDAYIVVVEMRRDI